MVAFSEVEEGGVGSTRDVVDDMGSRLEGSLGDFRFGGIYRDDALVRGKSFDHGQYAAKFLVNGSGEVVARFEPGTSPEEIGAELDKYR